MLQTGILVPGLLMRSLVLPLMLVGCAPAAEGLRATPGGDGPLVLIDWEALPLPELPFPNDLATVPDKESPTGLRVNIATEAETHFESEAREKLDSLFGFGIYAPISVRFTERLDVQNLIDRHPNDVHLASTFDDDAILVINVDPDSPEYGQPVHLDLGHGRYPYDAFGTNKYFANDTRSASPSIIFDTVDEDLNGNGIMDPGEDSDNDGLLDEPNVWPPGGDAFEDLLTFYDLGTDTLIVRPVVPMREQTTYAVVLTNDLIGADGMPVRSPWDYVHHTRQTAALTPLLDVLGNVGKTVDDVAFAWTFTTGRVTGDLRDIRKALYDNTGPYRALHADYPAGVVEALQIHERDDSDVFNLSTKTLTDVVGPLGLIAGEAGTDVLIPLYDSFADRMVGGSFVTANFLADVDDDGHWDADEWWKINPVTGSMVVEPERVPFSCVLPKADGDIQPPFDVLVYGHGYGSSRFETLLFAGIMNHLGFAVCSMDFPGHGPSLGEEERLLADVALGGAGLGPTLQHFFDSRQRDLNNSGDPDSGGDQWTSDAFHTRDIVRQAVVDWMQWFRALRACGEGEMDLVRYDAFGVPMKPSGTRVTCDWDDDGVADIGGPDAKFYLMGGSLGGMNAAVAAGVIPDIQAFAPIVPAGGIVDVGIRTRIGGAVEAFVGRFISPMFLALPDETGFQIVQLVNSVTDMVTLPIAHVDSLPPGGSVMVSNLATGAVAEGTIPADGRFRIAVGADALDAYEKRAPTGMPSTGPVEGVVYEPRDNLEIGDPLILEIRDADGVLVHEFDSWETDVMIEGVTLRAGSPLIAANEGNGEIRGSADARRLAFVTAMALEPGDGISYARHWFNEPFEDVGAVPQNVFMMPTPGDDLVPINGGIALARAAGIVNWWEEDPRYGMTVDQWLIDRQVVRGAEERGPYTNDLGESVLFDADDLDDGINEYGEPSDAPLRVVLDTPVGQSGMRLPYVVPYGTHGFREPDPSLDFDIHSYSIYQLASYVASGGQRIEDRPCYATRDCPEFRPIVEGGE